ncbi:hypothetical protein ACWCW2_37960 [Streptomyces sp. NPDC001773]
MGTVLDVLQLVRGTGGALHRSCWRWWRGGRAGRSSRGWRSATVTRSSSSPTARPRRSRPSCRLPPSTVA